MLSFLRNMLRRTRLGAGRADDAPTLAAVALPLPWVVRATKVDRVMVREATVGDLLAAEERAHPGLQPAAFTAHLCTLVIERAGPHAGPFTHEEVGKVPQSSLVHILDAASGGRFDATVRPLTLLQ